MDEYVPVYNQQNMKNFDKLSEKNKAIISNKIKQLIKIEKIVEDRKKEEKSKLDVVYAWIEICFYDFEFTDYDFGFITNRITKEEYLKDEPCRVITDDRVNEFTADYRIRKDLFDEKKVKSLLEDELLKFCYKNIERTKEQVKINNKYISEKFKEKLRIRKLEKINEK